MAACGLNSRYRRRKRARICSAATVSSLGDGEVIEVEKREGALVIHELVVLQVSVRGQPLFIHRDAGSVAKVRGEVAEEEMAVGVDVSELVGDALEPVELVLEPDLDIG